MAKAKISHKQKKSLKKSKNLILSESKLADFDFNNSELVKEILADCIKIADMNTFEDVFLGYIRSQSKIKLAAKSKLGRQTIYDLENENKKFNPEWDTFCALLKAI
jgi:DNA-binding phage protein